MIMVFGVAYFLSASTEDKGIPASEALKKLKEGNQRFVDERVIRPNQTFERVVKISEGQHPFVSILSCSDSRVPTEMLFDQGFGDIFSVRVAGNVADTDEIGTLEYGTEHLGTSLVVVLGHTKCGAVTAVVKGDSVHGHIPALVDNIIPAAKKAKEEGVKEEELIGRAIELNVLQSIEDILTKSEDIRHLVQSDRLTIVGAVYDIATGHVKWMGEHPDQARILQSFHTMDKKEGVTKDRADKSATSKEDLQHAGP
ncbi:MAG: carbonic anhydrase [Verrucomicrobiota bacterium]